MSLATPLVFLAYFVSFATSAFSIPWDFSWDTLSTFAFPGDAPRFMTPQEATHFSNFSMMLIWGMNATCYNASVGEYYQPDCYSSVMYCDKAHPETQPFVRNMETSLQEQGKRLKASRSTYFPVLGYIEGMSIQQTYAKQMALVDNNSSALLSIASKGLVDCFSWGHCNWQGVEFRQYDLRQASVVEYYAKEVIGTLINNPGLDGSFVDVIDFWESECGNWGCTAQETADLTQASLTAVDAALGYAASLGKVLSISSHTSLASYPAYYQAQLELLIKHGNGFRFWEFFTNTEDEVLSLAYETQTKGVPTHVHVTKRTLNPDWVELACFLLAMGEHSYFSYSGPWMLDSFDVFPEYSQPLGKPLGPPINSSVSTPTTPWQLLPGQNLVYGWPAAPNASASIPGKLAFLGVQPTATACLALAQLNASFSAITWVGNTQDAWALSCWGRMDSVDWGACINGQVEGAPCYAQMQGGGDHVSAVKATFDQSVSVWRRSFEHVNVSWFSLNNSAVMEGWGGGAK